MCSSTPPFSVFFFLDGLWVMCLHKLDSYRIINVEMQMKRGHPSAFCGGSIVVPSTCLSWFGRGGEPSRQLGLSRSSGAGRSGRTLYCRLKHGLSSLSDLAGKKKMEQKHPFFFCCFVLLFVLKQHLRRRSSPINSQQRGWVTCFPAAEGRALTLFILMTKHSTWPWEEIKTEPPHISAGSTIRTSVFVHLD